MNNRKHPVPTEYHELFAIGEKDRRGNLIDFKTPPIILDSKYSIEKLKEIILNEHITPECLNLVHFNPRQFIILRPTAIEHRKYVKEKLILSGLRIVEEFELDNFMKLADIIYLLDEKISYHWKWRIIMRILHEELQNQNKAIVFTFEYNESNERILNLKKNIRFEMGETPVLIKYNNTPKIALGIHHLHSPDSEGLAFEYNALMHAINKTSVFS